MANGVGNIRRAMRYAVRLYDEKRSLEARLIEVRRALADQCGTMSKAFPELRNGFDFGDRRFELLKHKPVRVLLQLSEPDMLLIADLRERDVPKL